MVTTEMQIAHDQTITCCAPLASPALTAAEAGATAGLFRALGDPARVRIVNVLATATEPVCACDLIEPLGLRSRQSPIT